MPNIVIINIIRVKSGVVVENATAASPIIISDNIIFFHWLIKNSKVFDYFFSLQIISIMPGFFPVFKRINRNDIPDFFPGIGGPAIFGLDAVKLHPVDFLFSGLLGMAGGHLQAEGRTLSPEEVAGVQYKKNPNENP